MGVSNSEMRDTGVRVTTVQRDGVLECWNIGMMALLGIRPVFLIPDS